MTENVTNKLMFEQLKAIRSDLAQSRDRDTELIRRIAGLETAIARLGKDNADTRAEQIEDRHSFDDLKIRIDRIERRLELSN